MMRKELEAVILDHVRVYCPAKPVALDDAMIKGLRLHGDDAEEMLMEIEFLFAFQFRPDQWSRLITIRDVVEAVEESGNLSAIPWSPRPKREYHLLSAMGKVLRALGLLSKPPVS